MGARCACADDDPERDDRAFGAAADQANQWTNIVVASLFILVSIGNPIGETWAFIWFGAIVEIMAARDGRATRVALARRMRLAVLESGRHAQANATVRLAGARAARE
jgi:hypothetical protein